MLRDELLEKGYIIVSGLIPQEMCDAVITSIQEHTKQGTEGINNAGIIELYHAQSMWNVRQYPLLYDVFKEIFQAENLWVSLDRCCYKKPNNPLDQGMAPHWDGNINQKPRPFEVQGLVALLDTTEDMGGFFCVPELYENLDKWLVSLPTGKAIHPYLQRTGNTAYEVYPANWEHQQLTWDIKEIPLKAGDLLIWHSFLAYGNGVNLSTKPRYAQYISMIPEGDERTRTERCICYLNGIPPSGWAFPGDPRNLEKGVWPPAELTDLGKKLLGISR